MLLHHIDEFSRLQAIKATMVVSTYAGSGQPFYEQAGLLRRIDGEGDPDDSSRSKFQGAEEWKPILSAALDVAVKAKTGIRVVLSKDTVLIQQEGDEFVALLFPTGDPVAKSLRRFIRRTAKKAVKPKPSPIETI